MEPIIYTLGGAAAALAATWARDRYAGFTAQRPEDYATGEAFDLRCHLNGPLICEGVIYGPTGRVSSRFVGDFMAEWQGSHGVMREVFRYDSGATQRREWRLDLHNDGHITARADDVVGDGSGWQRGSAVQLRYRLRLPQDAGGHVLDTIDWMYLAPNGSIVNRSQFRKFGIKVAELVATIRPVAA
jgi:hypothetical protein